MRSLSGSTLRDQQGGCDRQKPDRQRARHPRAGGGLRGSWRDHPLRPAVRLQHGRGDPRRDGRFRGKRDRAVQEARKEGNAISTLTGPANAGTPSAGSAGDLSRDRLARLRDRLATAPFDALVLVAPADVQYASGYRSVGGAVHGTASIAAVVTGDELVLAGPSPTLRPLPTSGCRSGTSSATAGSTSRPPRALRHPRLGRASTQRSTRRSRSRCGGSVSTALPSDSTTYRESRS